MPCGVHWNKNGLNPCKYIPHLFMYYKLYTICPIWEAGSITCTGKDDYKDGNSGIYIFIYPQYSYFNVL